MIGATIDRSTRCKVSHLAVLQQMELQLVSVMRGRMSGGVRSGLD